MKLSAWWVLPVIATLAACAGVKRDAAEAEAPPLDLYQAHAGAPVDRFHYPLRLRGWHAVDREHLVVRTDTNTAYLLQVAGGCVGLRTAHRIGMTTRSARNVVSSGLDEITLEHDRCRIIEIRPLDYQGFRAERRVARE
jgi:hypothetical protein